MKKIIFTVFLFNQKLENDLGIDLGKDGEIEAEETILISEIESIREAADENELLVDRCSIRTKSGLAFHVKGSYVSNLKRLEENGW